MKVTIGELSEELLFYSNKIEITSVNDRPFMRVYLGGPHNTTKAIIYIIQTAEHKYSVCDNFDDLLGEKYFPTGSISKPFIKEKELVNELFPILDSNEESYFINGLNSLTFINYLYNRLYYYNILQFNPNDSKIKISEMGFTSTRIRKGFDQGFKMNNCKSDQIKDLLNVVIKDKKPFNLGMLKNKEFSCIIAKMKDLGLSLKIQKGSIINIEFIRKK